MASVHRLFKVCLYPKDGEGSTMITIGINLAAMIAEVASTATCFTKTIQYFFNWNTCGRSIDSYIRFL